jgi:hypothetical protein
MSIRKIFRPRDAEEDSAAIWEFGAEACPEMADRHLVDHIAIDFSTKPELGRKRDDLLPGMRFPF